MLLTNEQLLGIKHGIESGFTKQGYSLSPREIFIIDLTIKSTVDIIEHMQESK